MMKCCCKNCDKRTPVCHAWCDSYKEWRKQQDAVLKAIEADRDHMGIARTRMIRDKWIRRVQRLGG